MMVIQNICYKKQEYYTSKWQCRNSWRSLLQCTEYRT